MYALKCIPKVNEAQKNCCFESSNNEKRGKKFFAFTFGFACATIATTKSQKSGVEFTPTCIKDKYTPKNQKPILRGKNNLSLVSRQAHV